MPPRLIAIVGLQKSGTTLLARLFQDAAGLPRLFQAEGDEFWGNAPPFTPTAYPAGYLYQRHAGVRGHELGAAEASHEVVDTMRARFEALVAPAGDVPAVVNKSPYNAVRLPWLRRIFPDAFIVAIVRHPRANVFSLVKKYQPDADILGWRPEAGWWGTKPSGWLDMVRDDKVEQAARQWAAVNAKLLEDHRCVDLFCSYASLCAEPAAMIRAIARGAGVPDSRLRLDVPPLNCFDLEYEHGSRLRSKNRYYAELGSLRTPASELPELGPLTPDSLTVLDRICAPVASQLGSVL